jgi:hypothetical protein
MHSPVYMDCAGPALRELDYFTERKRCGTKFYPRSMKLSHWELTLPHSSPTKAKVALTTATPYNLAQFEA